MSESVKITRAHITAASPEALLDVLGGHKFRTGGPVRRDKDGRTGIDVYVNADELRVLQGLAVTVRIIADHTATGKARQTEVGKGNRFKESGALPKGLGQTSGEQR